MADVRKRKKTTFLASESFATLEKLILRYTDIPITVHHKKAYEKYLSGEPFVYPRLIIPYGEEGYIPKKAICQTYIYEDQEELWERACEKLGCSRGSLMFTALVSYYNGVIQEHKLSGVIAEHENPEHRSARLKEYEGKLSALEEGTDETGDSRMRLLKATVENLSSLSEKDLEAFYYLTSAVRNGGDAGLTGMLRERAALKGHDEVIKGYARLFGL